MTHGNGNSSSKTRNNIKDKLLITSIAKTEATSVNVNLITTPDESKVVDVRNWFTTHYDDTPRPSNKGIWLPIELAEEVAKAILKAVTISDEDEAREITS